MNLRTPARVLTVTSLRSMRLLPSISLTAFWRCSTSPSASTNRVTGITLLSLSRNRYVPAPHAKCIDRSYLYSPVSASMNLFIPPMYGTENQSSLAITPCVCSSISFIAPGIVILCFSLCLAGILPTSDTGWKLTALTTSRLLSAKFIMRAELVVVYGPYHRRHEHYPDPRLPCRARA